MRSEKISQSLLGKFGENARRWKDSEASYAAIHMWITRHWGKPDHCDYCQCQNASRYEWCNLDKRYKRIRDDWIQLCPSCHRKFDAKDVCRNGHRYEPGNLRIDSRGCRQCRTCCRENQQRQRLQKRRRLQNANGHKD